MKSITDAAQAERIARSGFAVVLLVKLTPWTDKGAETAGTPIYISEEVATYDYATGGVQTFLPWLEAISPIRSAMTHIAGGSGSGITERTVEVTLHNGNWGAGRVADVAYDNTLEGAVIEISELAVDSRARPPLDLTSYTGNEHTVSFRGVVSRVLINNETVTLDCVSDLPNPSRLLITDDTTANPRDVGAAVPVPYGNCIVRCPNVVVGWVTNLTTDITQTSTGTFGVTDTTGFPAVAFNAYVGAELIVASVAGPATLQIESRSPGGAATPHTTGTPISEIVDDATWVISRYPIAALRGISVRNPLDGELITIPASFYTYTEEDTTTFTGETAATISMTKAQQYDLLAFLLQQQPATSVQGPDDVNTFPPTAASTVPFAMRDSDVDSYDHQTNGTNLDKVHEGTVVFTPNSAITQATVRVKLRGKQENFRVHAGLNDQGVALLDLSTADIDDVTPEWFSFPYDELDNFYMSYKLRGLQSPDDFCDVYEFERIETTEGGFTSSIETPSEVNAAIIAMNMDVYADVSGVAAPASGFTGGGAGGTYEFDDSGTWNLSNATTTRSTSAPTPHEGDASRQMTVQVSGTTTVVQSCNALTGWLSLAGAGLAIISNSGDNIIRTSYGDSNPRFDATYSNGSWGVNITDKVFMVDIWSQRTFNNSTPSTQTTFRISHDLTPLTNYWEWSFPMDWGTWPRREWVTVVLDYKDASATESGSVTLSAIDSFQIEWGGLVGSSQRLYINNVRTATPSSATETGVIQNNAIDGGPVDMTSGTDEYSLWVNKTDVLPGQLDIALDLSDLTGSGTTRPAARRELEFDASGIANGSWGELVIPGVVDTGGPDETAVETIRIAATMRAMSHGIYVLGTGYNILPYNYINDAIPDESSVNFDFLAGADVPPVAESDYVAAAGDVIELPVDVARHWINAVAGKTVDSTSWGTAETNLGANVLAGNAIGWSSDGTWIGTLDHIARISRANFVQEEEVAATRWRMLTADADYTFDSAARVRTLTLFEDNDVAEGGRDDSRDLFSRRYFVYAYSPQFGVGDEAYAKVLEISTAQNDSGTGVSAQTITDALAAFGDKTPGVEALLGIAEISSAQDIASWLYTEQARLAPIIVIANLSHSDGYDLETGDIVTMTRPWVAGALDLRLIEVVKDFRTQRVEIHGVSV